MSCNLFPNFFLTFIAFPTLLLGEPSGGNNIDSITSILQENKYPDNPAFRLKELAEVLTTVEDQENIDLMQAANVAIYKVQFEMGNFQEAYDFHKESTELLDSMFNEQKSRDIGKLEAKIEFEKKSEEQRLVKEATELKVSTERARKDNLQYSGILIFIVLLSIAIIGIGRLALPVRLVEGVIFLVFLLFFEFTLVLLDPYIEAVSGGAPAYKLLVNAGLAVLIFPLHSFFENYSKARITAQ